MRASVLFEPGEFDASLVFEPAVVEPRTATQIACPRCGYPAGTWCGHVERTHAALRIVVCSERSSRGAILPIGIEWEGRGVALVAAVIETAPDLVADLGVDRSLADLHAPALGSMQPARDGAGVRLTCAGRASVVHTAERVRITLVPRDLVIRQFTVEAVLRGKALQ